MLSATHHLDYAPTHSRNATCRSTSDGLDNRLQFSRIAQRVLNSHRAQLLLLVAFLVNIRLQTLVREVYPAVLDEPTSTLGKCDDGTFAFQEEKVLS
jgi:hypothetical protein